MVPGEEPWGSYMLGKHSITDLSDVFLNACFLLTQPGYVISFVLYSQFHLIPESFKNFLLISSLAH